MVMAWNGGVWLEVDHWTLVQPACDHLFLTGPFSNLLVTTTSSVVPCPTCLCDHLFLSGPLSNLLVTTSSSLVPCPLSACEYAEMSLQLSGNGT